MNILYKIRYCVFLLFFVVSCKNDSTPNKNTAPKTDSSLYIINGIQQSIVHYPDSMPLKVQLIDMLDSMKKYNEAIERIDCLINKDRFNNNLWLRKGQILREKGDTTKAIDAFNHSASIYPSPDILLELANLYAERKDPKVLEICTNIKKMALGQTNDSYASFFMGIYYARTHQKEKALQLFDMAINDNYTFPDAYLEKGYLFFESKQYEEAMTVFLKLSVINNTNPNAYYWMAKCNEAMNNKAEALTNYQKAYGLDKTNVEAKAAMERLSK